MIETIFFAAECAHVAVPEASAEAMRYYQSGNLLWIIQQGWALIVPLLFLLWGFTGKLSRFSEKWGKKWFFSIAIYLVLFFVIYKLLSFPLDLYSDYIREHAYNLSTQTFSRWLGNYGIDTLVNVVGLVAFVWIFYLLLKKSPKRWWFYSSIVSSILLFLLMFIQPIWIDPLFNKFGPMKNKELEQQILKLAAKAGIEDGRVFEVDKSQDTTKLNAYVTGFGKTNRIVLWDTTIEKMTPKEILFVMGHEMGHYVLHHVWWSFAYLSAISFAIFYLTYCASTYFLDRYKKRFGFKKLYDIASLPLLLFFIGFFTLLFTPLMNCISRHIEHEADRFGLEITKDNKSAAEAFLVLQHGNLANPRPGNVYKFWRSSHPPLAERIDFCNSYCPWKNDQPMRYSKYFNVD